MKARRQVDEMTSYLRDVVEFVRQDEFQGERLKAWREYCGGGDLNEGDDDALLDGGTPTCDWFLFDRLDSGRRKTPVRLFVDRHPDLPDRVRDNLMRCEDSLQSQFEVVETTSENITVLDLDGEPTDLYLVDPASCERELAVGDVLTTRLLRWDERYYFHGPQAAWPERVSDVVGPRQASRRKGHESDRRVPQIASDGSDSGLILDRRAWLRDRRRRP